ncbi:hypothetical protein TeGR_g14419 [Tetraparma gracilis]|uniref:Uncharacterized protein n=1 Tax=Tetraparma gracilis TaxID=2962635 RepID=A0ABQ6M4J0_9STRA|nr:hypothetical protein TeGR_g14419 [Tetraparma gracilis]
MLQTVILAVLLVTGSSWVPSVGRPAAFPRSSSLFSAPPTADPFQAPLSADDYIACGLAQCFRMVDGKLRDAFIYEPLTAGSLETIEKQVETSYKAVLALSASDFFVGDPNTATEINMANIECLKEVTGIADVEMCSNAVERAQCASRTFRRRLEAKTLAIGEMSDDYNFSTEKKRILDEVKVVSFDDNVKQDSSIDVYGRTDDEEAAAAEIEKLANA